MLNPVKFITNPEYLFNPRQALRRFRRLWKRPQARELIRLPWDALVMAHTGENIGRALYYYGIFDKVVPEAIARLLDPGEFGIEIGANIGQNCSIMARRSGVHGRVLAFEPHPEIVLELRENISRWNPRRFAPVQIEEVALGEQAGEAILDDGPEFATNRGTASLRTRAGGDRGGTRVRVGRLDDYLGEASAIGVCKMDVEGHELSVLRGADRALKRGAIRDLLFEDFNPQPSAVTALLQHHGYEVFHLRESWLKPLLLPLPDSESPDELPAHNYLATLDPKRTRNRFRRCGWKCLLGF